MVHIDMSIAIKELKKQYKNLSNDKIDKAIVRALNHTISKSRTEVSKTIRKEFGGTAKDIKKALRIKKANRFDHSARIDANIKPLPLRSFRPRQNKKGVSVRIRGKSRLIQKAFIATMKSGHKGVFARGRYEGQQFQFRKRRSRKKGNDLEINELFTSSVHKQMQNDVLIQHLNETTVPAFTSRLAHLLSRS